MMPSSKTVQTLQKNKRAALLFLKMVIAGKIDEAYEKYVDMDGKHHNTYFAAGFPLLRDAMKENHVKFPKKKFTVNKVLADGDLVVTHSHLLFNPKEPGMSVVHMFRFGTARSKSKGSKSSKGSMEERRIVEMWDCGQLIPKDMQNKGGAF